MIASFVPSALVDWLRAHHLGDSSLTIGVTFLLSFTAYRVANAATKRKSLRPRLPPGPTPLPLIGNLLDLPNQKEWLTYKRWSDRYGDVVYAEALGTKMVVLGSMQAVNDLLDRRSLNYSNRGSLIMLSDLMELDWQFSLINYGEHWKKSRRLFHTYVHSNMVHEYRPLQLRNSRKLCARFINDPRDLPQLVRGSFGATIMKMIYGIDVAEKDDPHLQTAERVIHFIGLAALPGHYMVDLFPFIRYLPSWFPGTGWQQDVKECKQLHTRLRDESVEEVRKQAAAGTAPSSWVQQELDKLRDGDAQTEQLIKDVAAIGYLAGADTTVSSIVALFLALIVYPDVQRRGQEEIDRVIGPNRLPEFEDADHLPYVCAIASECLRWIPVVPTSIPHAAAEDDEYKGMFIPKGSIMIPNTWAILHDPVAYPDPEDFKPERFLRRNTATGTLELDPSVPDPRLAAFGYGRRTCPGRHIAEQSLFAMVATILATLDVRPPKNEHGCDVIPIVDVTSGLLSHPKLFGYMITRRSEQAEKLVTEALSSH